MRTSHILIVVLALVCLLPAATTSFAEEEGPKPVPNGPSEAERARIKELVSELRQITSDIRGLAWKQPVEADLLTREQMMDYMKKSVQEDLDPEELERMTSILRRLGMIGPEEDPLQIALDMITSMAGGFFNPKTKKLYMLAGQDPESQKPTIVHELLHALEDQYIDLKARQEALKDDSDGMFAFKCLIEGSAEMARMLYEERDPEASRMQMAGQGQNKELIEGQRRTFANTPAFMMLDTLLHYKTGPNFVIKALNGPYSEKMDALYASPPKTQEQLLHPERWLGAKKDLPQEIVWAGKLEETLGEGWTELYDMPQGELDLALWLDFYLGTDDGKLSMKDLRAGTLVHPDARRASEGWDGGRMVFLRNGDKHIVVSSAFVFDTRKDADEAFEVLHKTLEKMNGDTWTVGALDKSATGPTTLTYVGEYGSGRLGRLGNAVLWLDGLEDFELDNAWPLLARTSFKVAQGDTWTSKGAEDPFDGCEIVHQDIGVGWHVPMSWTINEQAIATMRQAEPGLIGQLSRSVSGADGSPLGTVQVLLQTANQGMTLAVMPEVIKTQIAVGVPFAADRLTETTLSGMRGYIYDVLPPQIPQVARAVVLSNGVRSFIGIIRGPRAAVAAVKDDIEKLLDGIREKHVY